jgi:hypothetical protein
VNKGSLFYKINFFLNLRGRHNLSLVITALPTYVEGGAKFLIKSCLVLQPRPTLALIAPGTIHYICTLYSKANLTLSAMQMLLKK